MNVRRVLIACVLVTTLIAWPLGTSSQVEGSYGLLDLPAMALTPSDLENAGLTGFGRFGNGEFRSFGEYVARRAEFLNKPEEVVRSAFHDAGWRGGYVTNLGLPSEPGNPDSPPSRIAFSVVYEYADEEGAVTAYNFNRDYANVTIGAIEIITGSRTFADDSYLTRLDWTDPTDGRPSIQIDVTFRYGNIVATTGLIDFVETADLASPVAARAETVSQVETLADRLLERVDRVSRGESPGLSLVTYRLEDGATPVAFSTEGYRRLEGDDPPYYNGYEDDFPGGGEVFAEVTAAYELNQGLQAPGDPYYVVRLLQFDTAEQADAYVTWVRSEGLSPAGTPAETIVDATSLGDESWTLRYSAEFEPGHPIEGLAVYAQVDNIVMMLLLEGAEQPELLTFEMVASSQVTCLQAGSCSRDEATPPPVVATPT